MTDKGEFPMNKIPQFTAEQSLTFRGRYLADGLLMVEPIGGMVHPAMPMPFCRWEKECNVCGSPLPGYPPPICCVWVYKCDIHDTGPYSRGAFAF